MRSSKVRVLLESAVALCGGMLGVLTIFWHDWIEALTGWDPDQHNGTAEWIVVAGLLAVALASGLAARRHWKLLAAPVNNAGRLVPRYLVPRYEPRPDGGQRAATAASARTASAIAQAARVRAPRWPTQPASQTIATAAAPAAMPAMAAARS